MPQTESMVVATELERVLPKVPTLFDRDDVFYSTIEKRPVEVVSARDMRIPLELRPGGFFGYFDSENGDLGVGDGPTYEKAVISTVNMKHAIQWTTKSEWATDDKRKAVLNNLRELLAKSMKEFRRQVDSQCMTAGNGVVATVTSVATNTPVGFDTITCTTDGYGVRLLRYGQRVNVYNAARTTNRTAAAPLKINAVDLQNKTFQIPTGTAGIIGTDVILPEGLTGSTPVGLFGVPYHVNASTAGSWLGLPRPTTPEVVANRVNAAGALALPHGRLALNKIGDRVGMDNGFKPTAWMHPAQQQAYEELGQLVSMINKAPKEEGLNLYFNDNMQIAGAPIKTSYSWDKTRIDFIINDLWGRAEMKSAGFYEVDGRKIFEMRGPSGGVATSQVFYLVVSFNLFVKNPAACSYIDGLAVPAGY